ncbi:hypothetical protein P5673_031232, partial [Acropora cervicornis]
YGGYGESQIEIQTALCTLGEENLKEVCSGLKITLPPESKGSLRSYLEDKADLALAKLRRIMRWHYQERTSTELYDQLNSTVQQPKEKPQEFLIRLLDLKQKKSCFLLKKVIRNRKTILF